MKRLSSQFSSGLSFFVGVVNLHFTLHYIYDRLNTRLLSVFLNKLFESVEIKLEISVSLGACEGRLVIT